MAHEADGMEDWQRKGLEPPEMPSPKSMHRRVEELERQNLSLRHEVSRLKTAGLTGGDLSAIELFRLKEELFKLREENRLLKGGSDHTLRFNMGLRQMGRIMQSWLKGSMRGRLLNWRMGFLNEKFGWYALKCQLEKERDQARKRVRELEAELARLTSGGGWSADFHLHGHIAGGAMPPPPKSPNSPSRGRGTKPTPSQLAEHYSPTSSPQHSPKHSGR